MDYQKTLEKLGEELLKTPQYGDLEAAREALEEDTAAQVLLQTLEELRAEIASLREQGGITPEVRTKAARLNERMAANDALKEYRRAQSRFGEVLGQVKGELEEKTRVPFPAGCGGCPKK